MRPVLRKITVTAHITFSIGWLGAVAAFLAISIMGLTSHDPAMVRSTYLSMDLISTFVIIPMCFGALATGLIEATTTQLFIPDFTPLQVSLCGNLPSR